MEARVHFPLSVPGSPLTWIRADPVHATTVSLGLCVCQSWLQGIVSWMPPSLLVLLLFLPPLPHSFSRPEGRGFPLKTEHSFLYASPSCWSPYCFPFTARRSFSGDGWVRHWPMGIEECHWESFSCYVIRTGPMSSHVGILSTWGNTSRKQNKSLVTWFLQNMKSSWSVYLCFPAPQEYQKGVAYSRWLITTHCRLSELDCPLYASVGNYVFAMHGLSLVYSLNSCELYSYKLAEPLEYKLPTALNEAGHGIAAGRGDCSSSDKLERSCGIAEPTHAGDFSEGWNLILHLIFLSVGCSFFLALHFPSSLL